MGPLQAFPWYTGPEEGPEKLQISREDHLEGALAECVQVLRAYG